MGWTIWGFGGGGELSLGAITAICGCGELPPPCHLIRWNQGGRKCIFLSIDALERFLDLRFFAKIAKQRKSIALMKAALIEHQRVFFCGSLQNFFQSFSIFLSLQCFNNHYLQTSSSQRTLQGPCRFLSPWSLNGGRLSWEGIIWCKKVTIIFHFFIMYYKQILGININFLYTLMIKVCLFWLRHKFERNRASWRVKVEGCAHRGACRFPLLTYFLFNSFIFI